MKNKLLKSLPLIIAGLVMSNHAMAAYCSPDIANAIGQNSIAAQKYQKQISADPWTTYAKTEQSADDSTLSSLGITATSCMDAWPSGGFSFTIPTIDSVIKGVANAAIKKACNAAKEKVQDVTGSLSNSYFLNTGIDGMPSIGASTSNSGSLGSSVSKLTSQASSSSSSLSNTYSTISNLF